MKKRVLVFAIAIAASSFTQASPVAEKKVAAPNAQTAPKSAIVESAFSPDGGAEALILKVIDTSTSTIRLAAYSFTSPNIVRALVNAKKRGVDVKVAVDEKRNEDKANVAALNLLVTAAIPTRTVSAYALHHDKYIIADERTVQTGSFNYSKAAANRNSENVVVIWNNPKVAKSFIGHWEDRWAKGVAYKASF